MTKLIEFRERLRELYGTYEIYIKPAVRFALALCAFLLIDSRCGYNERLKGLAVALVLALFCCFFPMNVTVVLCALLILAHLSALSLEVCLVALLLFLLMFFLYYKMAPKEGYGVVLTPILCAFRIPEVMPLAIGLKKEPYSVLSAICGLVVYYFLHGIQANAAVFGAKDEGEEISKISLAIQQIVGNKELYVMIVAFVVTALVTYVIRRQSFAHSWDVAIGVGCALDLLVMMVGNVLVGNGLGGASWMLLGSVVAALVGFAMEFCLFHLDYSRTERVQFEDDEYYYYVKAVPKVTVSTRKKQVKQISGRRKSGFSKDDFAEEFEIDRDLLDD